MKIKPKSQKGLTLVELVIAIAAGVILILAVGIILFIGQTFWNQAWKKVNLQRDASYAMLRMSRSIKAGTAAEVLDDGKTVIIYRNGDDIRFWWVEGQRDLRSQITGKPETIINNQVETLQFSVDGNKVTIDLKLKEDDARTYLVSTVTMRNYGG
jgi:Tfp pilus assembly protein FimT